MKWIGIKKLKQIGLELGMFRLYCLQLKIPKQRKNSLAFIIRKDLLRTSAWLQ